MCRQASATRLATGAWIVLAATAALAGCRGRAAEPAAPPSAGSVPGAAHARMLEQLAAIAAATEDENPFLETRTVRGLRQEVEQGGEATPWTVRAALGIAELRAGHEEAAIAALERAREIAAGPESGAGAEGMRQLDFQLAVAYLRLGETQNCCRRRTAESCILPIRGGGVHALPEGSRRAIERLQLLLAGSAPDSKGALAARWLLNVAAMTVGAWPHEVPERWRLPAEIFAPEIPFPRFANIAAELGLDTFNLAGGVIVDDFDGDDHLDVVVSTMDPLGQIRLFGNRRDGTFVERTQEAGLQGLLGGLNLVQADYDNDGDLDFFVLRGAWLDTHGRHPNSLVRNEGDGTFTDVTFAAGLGEVHYPTQTAAWADYDNDGDLDLYVGNETRSEPHPSQLFRNEGNGTFTDVAAAAGVENLAFAKGVAWGDYDGDHRPDLYVSNNGQANRLYHNDGNGRFTDLAPRLGVTGPLPSFPCWFWDFDNDGSLDLYVSSYKLTIAELAGFLVGLPAEFVPPALYRGDGRGGFRDVAREVGLALPMLPMGANFGDLDNDGFLDFYLGTGDVDLFTLMPNLMFLNRGGRRFQNVTMAGGFGHLQKGHGIAFADLDHDGDSDVFAQMGGALRVDAFANVLFENPGFGNRWLTIQLVGTRSNRSAIGARIRVEVEEDGGAVRSIYRHVSSGGSFGAHPLRQTLGLGRARGIRRLEILWPTTGITQVVEDVGLDRAIRVVEGEPGHATLDLAPLRLGGPAGARRPS
jgi:hypothetical protein